MSLLPVRDVSTKDLKSCIIQEKDEDINYETGIWMSHRDLILPEGAIVIPPKQELVAKKNNGPPRLKIIQSRCLKKGMSHSTSIRTLSPGLDDNNTFNWSAKKFPKISYFGKLSELYFNVLLFSIPGDQVVKSRKTMGQICTVLSTRTRSLSPGLEYNNSLKCTSESLKLHFNLSVFSNQGDKVLNHVEILFSQDLSVSYT